MPYLDDAGQAYFRHWSTGPATASVVLLHGFGEHTGHYHRLAYALNGQGLDVWGLDHIGHGLSAGERGLFPSVEALGENAALLIDLVETEHPDRPVFLVGHSLGGVTAALLAVRGRRLDGLVLTGTPLSGLPEQVADDPVMSTDPFYLDALETDPLGFDTVPAEASLWQAIGDCVPELRAGLRGLDLPVLMVNGDQDAYAPVAEARSWAARMPDASVVVVSGFHDIVNDVAHQQVAREIGRFITQHAIASAPLSTTR
jgi:alpha-beta hydrolase superfamily lysophospholipase